MMIEEEETAMEVDDFESNSGDDQIRMNRDQTRKMSIGDNDDSFEASFGSGFNSLLAAETVQSITGGKKVKSSTKSSESSQQTSRRKSTEMNVETDNRPANNNNSQSSSTSHFRGYRYFHLPTTNPLISMNQSSTQQSQSPTNSQQFQSKFDQFQHRRSFITPSMFGGRFRHLQSLHSEANFLGLNSIHRCLGSLPVGCVFRSSLPATPVATPIHFMYNQLTEEAIRDRLVPGNRNKSTRYGTLDRPFKSREN